MRPVPGRPSIRDEHYPPRPAGALERRPRARSADEQAFLAIGPGAERWLIAAAAAGTTKLRRKLAEATALAKLHGPEAVDEALTVAADAGRFGDGDLAAIQKGEVTDASTRPERGSRRAYSTGSPANARAVTSNGEPGSPSSTNRPFFVPTSNSVIELGSYARPDQTRALRARAAAIADAGVHMARMAATISSGFSSWM